MNRIPRIPRGALLNRRITAAQRPRNVRKSVDMIARFGCAGFGYEALTITTKEGLSGYLPARAVIPCDKRGAFAQGGASETSEPGIYTHDDYGFRAWRFAPSRNDVDRFARARPVIPGRDEVANFDVQLHISQNKNGGVSPAVSFLMLVFAISAGAAAHSAATGLRARARRPRSTGGSTAPGCWPLPRSDRPRSGWTNRSAAR
jgi:hypothetical protein